MLRSLAPWEKGITARSAPATRAALAAIRAAVFAVCMALAPAAATAQSAVWPAAGEVLTLDEAVALALAQNRTLQNTAVEVDKAGDRLAVAKSYRLPTLDIYFLHSKPLQDISFEIERGALGDFSGTGPIPAEDTDIGTTDRWTSIAVASVTQPISQLHAIGLGVRLQEVSLDLAREDLRSSRQALVNDVRALYYRLLQSQSALAAVEESIQFYRELDRVVENQVAVRAALRADGLEVKARLAAEEHRRLTQRNALDTQKEQLNGLLGRDVRTPFALASVPEAAPFEADLEEARSKALAHRPDLRGARLRLRQAEFDYRLKRAESIPDLSLSLNYLSPFNVGFLPKNIATAGLLLTWDPFDGGRRRRQTAEAGRTRDQADRAWREAEAQTLIDVGARFRALEEARSLLQASRLAEEAARERLKVAKDRFERQAILLKDLLQAQDTLADARLDSEQALLQFWSARADLERAIGED